MPSFRFSSWFLEHPSSSSIGPLSGALIWPGDRAPPWLQVVPCPGAARDEGVFLLLGWRVGLWLPRALSTLRDEGIRLLWYNCNLFITCSPYWQLCVNQNLAVLIAPDTSMRNCIPSDFYWSFPFLAVTLGDPQDYLANSWSSLKLLLALLSLHPGLVLDASFGCCFLCLASTGLPLPVF